jgi:hypothetical protein
MLGSWQIGSFDRIRRIGAPVESGLTHRPCPRVSCWPQKTLPEASSDREIAQRLAEELYQVL